MPSTKINEDILKERKKCTFNQIELTHLFDGGPEKTQQKREMCEFFLTDPELQDKVPTEYLSHKEKYEEAVRKSCLLAKKVQEWQNRKNSGSTVDVYSTVLGGMLGSAILQDGMPLTLHFVMFLPTIMNQGTIEQQTYWVGRAWNCEIIGTYAQTELGHGTFVRGLETTAHYDPKTEEFVLHSPTLTSYKWWPGGLGHSANYAVVMAQLHTQGQCKGIHPFIVQLRDEDTHMPLRGITIGEIGAKMGMNATNNGYLGFNQVRIPRENMLMKNSKVLKDGTYISSPSDKLTYGSMIFVRVTIVKGVAAHYLAKAVTIATRYSAVRRQSELRPGEPEPQIIDYVAQQQKLFPNIAAVFGMIFSAQWLWDMYNNVLADLDQGVLDKLPELHAMSCCLKAVCTSDSARGIEECRKSCGGHGFMTCSSMPIAYGLATAAETYEGENTVMYLQTARFLVKTWHQIKSGKGEILSETTKYLARGLSSAKYSWNNNLDNLVDAFYQVAIGLIAAAADKVDHLVARGKTHENAWNESSNLLVQCAEAHCRAFMVSMYAQSVREKAVSQSTREVLNQLCELYCVNWILTRLGWFLMYSHLKVSDVPALETWQQQLLAQIRPNAVSIVDSFDICDEILGSPLGAYDGNVYERLYAEAQKSPLNKQPVNESFHKYLKPFLKSNL